MKPEQEQAAGRTDEAGKVRSQNRLFAFIICLFISAFIWFLIVLSKETNTIIEYPVVFENNPRNLALTEQSDSVLSLNVSSGSVELITLKYLSSRNPVKIDLKGVRLSKEDDLITARISTQDIARKLINRMSVPEDHVTVTPEFITLRFEAISGTKLKVVPNLLLDFEPQFQLSQELQVIPDSVIIVGSGEAIQKLGYIETEKKEIKKINQTQTVNVPLILPNNTNGLKVIPETVNVVITVDKFTESSIEVPVHCVPPDLGIKTFPETVKITYFVTLENFDRIEKDMFLANVIYQKEHPAEKLKVNLIQYPSYIKIIKTEPEEVEFLVIK